MATSEDHELDLTFHPLTPSAGTILSSSLARVGRVAAAGACGGVFHDHNSSSRKARRIGFLSTGRNMPLTWIESHECCNLSLRQTVTRHMDST